VRRGPRVFVAALGVALVASMMGAASASATFHLMKIREVTPGAASADASYVEVQMYAGSQNFLSNGAMLVRCNSTCSSLSTFSPFTDVTNGMNQDTVLFADSGVAGASKDFNVDLNLDTVAAGGAVCYLSEPGFHDCVSWGTFTGNSTLTANYGAVADPGTPAAALSAGTALRRSIAPGCPTMLEAGDDTNDSSVDFQLSSPNPRTNSSPILETPCASAGPSPSPAPGPGPTAKKRCKKHKRSAEVAKKKCKKRK
jgi:hypothetical protein